MKRIVVSLIMICGLISCFAQNSQYFITSEGVGPVKIGKTTKELPAKADGLYDKVVEENSDMVFQSFYLDGVTVITTNGDGLIEMIEISYPYENVSTQDGVYSGMSAYDFKQKKGWKQVEPNRFEKDGVTVYIQEYEDSEPCVNTIQIGEYSPW